MKRGKKTMKGTREESRLSGGKPTGTQAYPKETRTASVGGATRSVTSPGTALTWSTTGTTPYLPSKGKGLIKATQAREGAKSIGKGPEEGPDTKGDRGRTPPKTPASGTMWLGNALDASRWAIL